MLLWFRRVGPRHYESKSKTVFLSSMGDMSTCPAKNYQPIYASFYVINKSNVELALYEGMISPSQA